MPENNINKIYNRKTLGFMKFFALPSSTSKLHPPTVFKTFKCYQISQMSNSISKISRKIIISGQRLLNKTVNLKKKFMPLSPSPHPEIQLRFFD